MKTKWEKPMVIGLASGAQSRAGGTLAPTEYIAEYIYDESDITPPAPES